MRERNQSLHSQYIPISGKGTVGKYSNPLTGVQEEPYDKLKPCRGIPLPYILVSSSKNSFKQGKISKCDIKLTISSWVPPFSLWAFAVPTLMRNLGYFIIASDSTTSIELTEDVAKTQVTSGFFGLKNETLRSGLTTSSDKVPKSHLRALLVKGLYHHQKFINIFQTKAD